MLGIEQTGERVVSAERLHAGEVHTAIPSVPSVPSATTWLAKFLAACWCIAPAHCKGKAPVLVNCCPPHYHPPLTKASHYEEATALCTCMGMGKIQSRVGTPSSPTCSPVMQGQDNCNSSLATSVILSMDSAVPASPWGKLSAHSPLGSNVTGRKRIWRGGMNIRFKRSTGQGCFCIMSHNINSLSNRKLQNCMDVLAEDSY